MVKNQGGNSHVMVENQGKNGHGGAQKVSSWGPKTLSPEKTSEKHCIAAQCFLRSRKMKKKITIYLAGTIKKSHEKSDDTCWRALK